MTTVHRGGRPLDTAAAPKLMAAARDLINRFGYGAVTMVMIADAAGVGRQTVYRRWRSKADLVLDAYLASATLIGAKTDGPVRGILQSFLIQVFKDLERDGDAIRSLIASAQEDDTFRATLDDRFARPRNEVVLDILRRGIATGEVAPDANLSLSAEVVHGAYWYRLLLGRPLTDAFARELTDLVLQNPADVKSA